MNRAERIVAISLFVAALGSVAFIVAYATGGDHAFEGSALALATAGFATAALGWAFGILPHEEVVDLREEYPSPRSERRHEELEVRRVEREVSRSACPDCDFSMRRSAYSARRWSCRCAPWVPRSTIRSFIRDGVEACVSCAKTDPRSAPAT